MSNYGPPDGAYPGPPQDPWHGHDPGDPYGQPPQRWGDPDQWAAPTGPAPGSTAPSPGYPPYEQPGYGDEPGGYRPAQPDDPGYHRPGTEPAWWAPDPAPPGRNDRKSRRPIVALVLVLTLLICAGAVTLYLLGRNDEQPRAQPSPSPTGAGPGNAPTSTGEAQSSGPGPRASQTSRPAPQSSADARFVKVGQCVKNVGGTSTPKLVITRCGSQTYQVLARFDGATTGERDAKTKCGKVAGYTDWYFFNSELDVLDFVLCLKLR